jgi:hypothetical protein
MDWRPGEIPARRRLDDPSGAGVLITRPLRFSGQHLFVNADLEGGELRVEALNQDGTTIAAFARDRCTAVTGNGTRLAVNWSQAAIGSLAGQPIRLKFVMTRGRLYSFWISPWPSGESRGYPAAGGPEFARSVDTRDK